SSAPGDPRGRSSFNDRTSSSPGGPAPLIIVAEPAGSNACATSRRPSRESLEHRRLASRQGGTAGTACGQSTPLHEVGVGLVFVIREDLTNRTLEVVALEGWLPLAPGEPENVRVLDLGGPVPRTFRVELPPPLLEEQVTNSLGI